jgi:hypothetical protein
MRRAREPHRLLSVEREYRRVLPRASGAPAPAPLVWTFDGPFALCLADLEDALRRAVVMLGGVARIELLVELSLPALKARVAAGDRIQPAWADFHRRLADYGLPSPPRLRPVTRAGALATLVIAYRN